MKLILINKVILIILTLILLSCNNTRKSTPIINNSSEEKEVKRLNSSNITGYWKSVNDNIVKNIVISKVNSNTYKFKTTFKDGGVKDFKLTLNDKEEYHTNNSFGEYYKLSGETLGIYDNQGLIAYYKR